MAERNYRFWTDDEIDLLFTDLTVPEIAQKTGRSETAVMLKRQDVGLKWDINLMSLKAQKQKTEQVNAASKARYNLLKDEGLCTRCGQRWAEAGGTRCRPCRERDRKWYQDNNMGEYSRKYRAAQKEERRKAGQCIQCGARLKKEELGINTQCGKCRKKQREREEVRRIRERIAKENAR